MRHRKDHSKLNRDTDHRKALKRNLLRALFTHERIVTTVPKAKELRRHSDKLITLGKRGDLHARRLALRILPDKGLVKKIFDEIAPRYQNRPGGYTRVIRYVNRRGDNAPLAVVELVQEELKIRVKRKKIKEERAKMEEEKREAGEVKEQEKTEEVREEVKEEVKESEVKEETKEESTSAEGETPQEGDSEKKSEE